MLNVSHTYCPVGPVIDHIGMFGSVRFIWSGTKKLWTGGRALSPADPILQYE
jgi:hypothetical protein